LTVLSCPVLSCPYPLFSILRPGRTAGPSRFMAQTTCFRVRMVLLGLERWVTIFGGSMHTPPPPKKSGVNREFQAKTDVKWVWHVETGNRIPIWRPSVFISAVDWDISLKFCIQIDFYLLKQMLSLNLNPGVDFRLEAAILKIRYGVISPPWIVRLLRNLAGRCKMTCRWLRIVKLETGNRIPIWRPSIFLNRK